MRFVRGKARVYDAAGRRAAEKQSWITRQRQCFYAIAGKRRIGLEVVASDNAPALSQIARLMGRAGRGEQKGM
ncbi:uncharacterized protein LY79DRAFT_561529, partial [Colletotrichum navitas]